MHGSEICFLKFLNAWRFYNADVIILAGDLTGKVMIPIVEQPDGSFVADYLGTRRKTRKNHELERLEKNIRDIGYYSFRTSVKQMEDLQADDSRMVSIFKQLIIERAKDWVRIADQRLAGTTIRCFVSAANDDDFAIDSILSSGERIVAAEKSIVDVDGDHQMVTSGFSNMTPWKCERDVSEDELWTRIDSLAANVDNMANAIFNFHCPPFDSLIDEAPKLDETLRPIVGAGGEITMFPVGSTAVRKAIDKYQPMLGLHGHIHESAGTFCLGRTLCINPGSEYSDGVLRGAIVDVDDKSIKKFVLTKG